MLMRSNRVEVPWRQSQYRSMVWREVSYPQARNDPAPLPGNSPGKKGGGGAGVREPKTPEEESRPALTRCLDRRGAR